MIQKNTSFITIVILLLLLPSCTTYKKATQEAKKNSRAKTPLTKSSQEELVAPLALKKNIKTLTLEELVQAKEYCIATENKPGAVTYLEQLIVMCSDQNILKEIKLELADLYFDQGSMEKAGKLYTNYLSLYPGSEHRAYVHYRAILCRFYQTFTADRDQTRTEETLVLTQEYLNRSKTDKDFYTEYVTDVENVQKQCCRKLYDHDVNIFNFYYNKGSYKAAEVRIAHIRKQYMKLYKEVEPELLMLEYKLAQQQKDTTVLLAKQAELQTKYPSHHATLLAQQNPAPKKSYVTRF